MPQATSEAVLRAQRARLTQTFVAVAVGLSASFFAQQALRRFYTLHNHTFDLALYARLAHGMAGGDFHTSVLDLSFFAAHTPWVLLPLGWLGRVLGTVQVLLVAQALCMALPALPLFRLGLRVAGPGLGGAAALAYLLYPNLSHVASYEFHPGNLALPGLSLALLAAHEGNARKLLWGCVLVLICRADLALVTTMLGLTVAWGGARALGLRIALASLGYLGLCVLGQVLTAQPGVTSMDLHFGPWGGGPLGIVTTLVADPGRVLEHFIAAPRLSYLPRVLGPLLLLPLLGFRFLLPALPLLAINLISVFPTTTGLYSHYLTPAVPSLVAAAVVGSAGLTPQLLRLVPAALVLAALGGQWAYGGLPFARAYVAMDYRADGQTRVRAAVVAAVSAEASVQAPDPLLPHLAERAVVHRAPPPERGTDVVILDLSHRARYAGTSTLLRTSEEPIVRNWLAREDYGLTAAYPGYAVLVRGHDPRAGWGARYFASPLLHDAPRTRLAGCLDLIGTEVVDVGIAILFHARAKCPADLALRLRDAEGHERVDLLFDGLLSPAHLRAGDVLRSVHPWSAATRNGPMKIGLLRSSGARPAHGDPTFVQVVPGR